LKEDYPEWELGFQIVEESDVDKFDFDLLDPTKIIPEELVPVRKVGKMVLNKNPENFFAETEQVAFCPSHIVPGIDFSNDPLLQGRLFSYLDTQISRLGVNFAELPINRPICPVHNNTRDGKMRFTVDQGRGSYNPNTLSKGCPAFGHDLKAFKSFTEVMSGEKTRERSPSFKDHFSQATMFWNSMSLWEKEEIISAFSFELNMCDTPQIRKNVLNNLLVNIHSDLANAVADNIGLQRSELAEPKHKKKLIIVESPTLSLDKPAMDIKGRKIAMLTADGVDPLVSEMKTLLEKQGAVVHLIGYPHGGSVKDEKGNTIPVDKSESTGASVLYDAVIVLDGMTSTQTLSHNVLALSFVSEAFVHKKTIMAIGQGRNLLKQARIDCENEPGIVVGGKDDLKTMLKDFVEDLKRHRHHNRNIKRVILCE